MSVIVLPTGTVKRRVTSMPQARVWQRPPLKRILQFTLIAMMIVPIPSDDGPVRTPVTAHKAATLMTQTQVLSVHQTLRGGQR